MSNQQENLLWIHEALSVCVMYAKVVLYSLQ